jgi:hypothetical protein
LRDGRNFISRLCHLNETHSAALVLGRHANGSCFPVLPSLRMDVLGNGLSAVFVSSLVSRLRARFKSRLTVLVETANSFAISSSDRPAKECRTTTSCPRVLASASPCSASFNAIRRVRSSVSYRRSGSRSTRAPQFAFCARSARALSIRIRCIALRAIATKCF